MKEDNLAMTWIDYRNVIDYRKALDIITYSWILKCMQLFSIVSNVEWLLRKSVAN